MYWKLQYVEIICIVFQMQNDPGYRYMLFAIGLIFVFFLFYDSWKTKTPKGESYKLMQGKNYFQKRKQYFFL